MLIANTSPFGTIVVPKLTKDLEVNDLGQIQMSPIAIGFVKVLMEVGDP